MIGRRNSLCLGSQLLRPRLGRGLELVLDLLWVRADSARRPRLNKDNWRCSFFRRSSLLLVRRRSRPRSTSRRRQAPDNRRRRRLDYKRPIVLVDRCCSRVRRSNRCYWFSHQRTRSGSFFEGSSRRDADGKRGTLRLHEMRRSGKTGGHASSGGRTNGARPAPAAAGTRTVWAAALGALRGVGG